MAFDFKKEYRELYVPKTVPGIVTVPRMNYLAVRGQGDPNEAGGTYKQTLSLLYGLAYTIRMTRGIEGFFDYVVPPLEGFWRQPGPDMSDHVRKEDLRWISVLRLPDFVTEAAFDRAAAEAAEKKKKDFSKVEFLSYDEGFCVQCMHLGPYDGEAETIARMHAFAGQRGCVPDLTGERMHHEIYLSDPRKTAPEKLRTVIRHPIRKR